MIVTDNYIKQHFPFAYCADTTYYCPSHQWMDKCFRYYKGVVRMLNILAWKTHNDCDDKATGFRWLAGVLWGRAKERPAQAVAIAEVHYKRDKGGAHAINAVFMKNGSICYVEPQGPEWVHLSAQEIDSIYFVRL